MLQLARQLSSLSRLGRRHPAGQQRSGGNRPARGRRIRLGREMPDVRMAVAVGMRVGGKDVGRHVLREIPFLLAHPDREIKADQVAGGVSLAGSDHQADGIAATHFDGTNRTDRRPLAPVVHATAEHLPRSTAPHLERPDGAVATAAFHALDRPVDPHRGRRRAPPADDHPLLGVGVHDHAVGFHAARNPHLLIRRVGQHLEESRSAPSIDALPVLHALDLPVEQRLELCLRPAHPQILEPPGQQRGIDGMLLRQRRDDGRRLCARGLGHGREAFGRGRGEPLTLRGKRADRMPHEPQRQVGPAGRHEPRIFPDDEVLVMAISGVGCRQLERDRIFAFGHGELHAELLPVHER